MALKDLKVGDPIYLSSRFGGTGLRKVKRVGRKYIYLEGREQDGFDRETGRINDDYGNAYVYTVEDWEKKASKEKAEKQLSDWGLQFNYGPLSSKARERAVKIVEALRPLFEEKPDGEVSSPPTTGGAAGNA